MVGDVRQQRLDVPPAPEFFSTFAQMPMPFQSLVVRGARGRMLTPADVREVVRRLDPGLAVANLMPLAEYVRLHTRDRQFALWVLTAFAALAVALGAVGCTARSGGRRPAAARDERPPCARRDARRRPPTRVLADGLRVVAAGAAAGLLLAALSMPLMRSLLFGVAPLDPVAFLTVPALLIVVAIARAGGRRVRPRVRPCPIRCAANEHHAPFVGARQPAVDTS